ncbi:mandelate racemase/muconate lactonizing enzyme family protein [Paenibacillus sp. ATY16]|uniref:mandelate racemase/muconate lactonizing enzyme family protein n=1 Tax=Paenibacillus sp. ATY16 TaxID=1759312 RepID=UPI00200E5DC0|nr:mandelate racemase/muconate lactonizing enzyme family protein [Paenibacillus sp. ATY16]MCK9862944.1 mandelate racemase/muconate lactonizing enzyme family protein [Paenibacillus sp. ATY16]
MTQQETYDSTLAHVNTYSKPSELRITDIRFADIAGAPMHCSLIKVFTNQGIVGFGEVRDGADKQFALQLKSRLLGENPCNIDKLFRRIKQFGGHSRQGGGVSGIEIALWDIAGKAYGMPIYQMLGGKFRDKIRMYCDTDVDGKDTGKAMGLALQKRMEQGYTFLKMDLGINQIINEPGTLSAPLGFLEDMKALSKAWYSRKHSNLSEHQLREIRSRHYDIYNIAHPFTGIHVTEKGLDMLEQYVADVRMVVGYEVPLAVDHFGHIGLQDCIKLGRRIEKYNLAWMEDMIPWQYTNQYAQLASAVTTPVCTGEDIYLKENFKPLLEYGGVSVIHPDVLTTGGILETKKIGDMAQEYGVAMAIHMAESPIACLAAVHAAAATENFLALEYHSVDVDWWDDLIVSKLPKPLVQNGFIHVPDAPGLGIESLNDEVIALHLHPEIPGLWLPTDEWNGYWSNDRLWS